MTACAQRIAVRPDHPEQGPAAARSEACRLFAAAFGYPEGALRGAIASGELAAALRAALAGVDASLAAGVDEAALSDAGEGDALAVEYTRLFDVGASGPPCPLYGGVYGGARMATLEEVVRFYEHFGLKPAEPLSELPDHLATELEFLHFLAYREVEALAAGADPGPFRRAQRDFVARHPGRWLPGLRARLESHGAVPYFRELARLLAGLLEHEHARLLAQVGAAPPDAKAPA